MGCRNRNQPQTFWVQVSRNSSHGYGHNIQIPGVSVLFRSPKRNGIDADLMSSFPGKKVIIQLTNLEIDH